jgi:hypothetical protein
MSKLKQDAVTQITAVRASRLYRLLSMLGNGRQPRETLLRRLKIDLRGYYRDLELLRSLGITVCVQGTRYQLVDPLDSALARLPVPDPRLNVRDALLLARGTTDAHRRFRRQLDSMIGPTQRSKCDGGPHWNEEA